LAEVLPAAISQQLSESSILLLKGRRNFTIAAFFLGERAAATMRYNFITILPSEKGLDTSGEVQLAVFSICNV